MTWLRQLIENEQDQGPQAFLEALKVDLFEDEVFVFTPKGEVKNLAAGSTPLDFAYSIHTDVGHHCVGAKVNGKIVPLHYQLRSGDIVEVLTAKQGRGPSRDWLKLVRTTRARNKIRAWFSREGREDAEHEGRDQLAQAFKKRGLPYQKLAGSPLLVDVIREMGFRKADDFYIALGQSQDLDEGRHQQGDAAAQARRGGRGGAGRGPDQGDRRCAPPHRGGDQLRNQGQGRRATWPSASPSAAARCPGDEIVGYVSLGRGITVHREDCRNVAALKKAPERFTEVELGRRQRVLVPRGAPGRRLGPNPPPRGPLPDLRGGRPEHPRGALHDQAPDGEEPLRARGGRYRAAQAVHLPAAERRFGLRRVPGHAHRLTPDADPPHRRIPFACSFV